MKRVAIVVIAAGCSAIFGIDEIPYDPGPIDLTVMVIGQGSGKVADNLGMISCTTSNPNVGCSATYSAGASVTLTSSPIGTSSFELWSGPGCSGTGSSCNLTNASGAITVFAEFENIPAGDRQLKLQPTGTNLGAGSGSAAYIMTPAGICTADDPCAFGFDPSTTSVTITAVNGTFLTFSTFTGGGCATGSDTCTVVFDSGSNGSEVMVEYDFYSSVGSGTDGSGGS